MEGRPRADMATATARDTARDTVTLVTVEEAALLARVSVRTIRRWIQYGYLSYEYRGHEKVVSPADLPAARRAAGHGRGRGHGRDSHESPRGHERRDTDTDTDTAMPPVTVSLAAHAQLAALRDEWVAPFVAQIAQLEREVGRLSGERVGAEEARRRTDDLVTELRRRAEVAEAEAESLRLRLVEATPPAVVVVAGQETTEAPRATATTPAAHRPAQRLWQRLRQRFGGG